MSVIFNAALPATTAQTHAFVIGVGEYPFLLGGHLNPGAMTMGLGQLTSSVKSAEAFAYWLTSKFTSSSAPLGSVELLLSPNSYAPAGQPAQAVDRATLDNIKVAFKRWYRQVPRPRRQRGVVLFQRSRIGEGVPVAAGGGLCRSGDR